MKPPELWWPTDEAEDRWRLQVELKMVLTCSVCKRVLPVAEYAPGSSVCQRHAQEQAA